MLFVGTGPQQQRRVFCGVEIKVGKPLREANTAYGTQPPVEAEPLCRLGCVKLGKVGLG